MRSYFLEEGCDVYLVATHSTEQDDVFRSDRELRVIFFLCSFGRWELFEVACHLAGQIFLRYIQ